MTEGYPLAALLALREREEEAARAVLAGALAAEDRARQARDARSALLDEAARRAAAGGPRGADATPAAALQAAAGYARRLRREETGARAALAAGEAALAGAGEALAAARTALAAASAARDAIGRHHAAWEDARRRLRERAEEGAQDELASARTRAGG